MLVHSHLFIILMLSFAFIINPTKAIERDIIALDFFVVTSNELLVIPMSLGTPAQSFNFVLDIGAERTWISNEIFKKDSSSTYQAKGAIDKKSQGNFIYSGELSTETFQLSSKSLEQFDFMLVNQYQGTPPFEGVISFGREYDSKRYALAYILTKYTTYYNTFSIKFRDMNKGIFYIGDLTDEIRDYEHLVQTCDLISQKPKIKWMCELTHVFIGERGDDIKKDAQTKQNIYKIDTKKSKVLKVNAPAAFETVYNRIYAPMEFFTYLKENVFIDENNKQICSFIAVDGFTRVKCSREETAKVKTINFVFSSRLDLLLTKENLFDCMETCEFVIVNDAKIDHWIIGLPILKLHQVIFDYNSSKLSFYGAEHKDLVQMEGGKSLSVIFAGFLTLFIGIIIVGSLGIAIIYMLRSKNKQRKNIENEIYEKF